MCMVHTYAHALYETLQHDRALLMHMEACASRCLNASAHKGRCASFAGFQRSHLPRTDVGDMMCIYASQKRHEHDHACALGPCRKRYTTNLPSNHIFRRNDERNHRRAVAASVFVAFSSHAIVSADKKHMPALWADSRECQTTGEA